MKVVINKTYTSDKALIFRVLKSFNCEGRDISTGKRNTLKILPFKGEEVNIKAFKIPNALNKVIYRFFRKSKAERSFTYALELLERGIQTPEPVAYAEDRSRLFFLSSYYISKQLEYDLTFRDIDLKKNGDEAILRAFTRFTFELHEKQIEFLDHSPGNTLIKITNEGYEFYLVDLNRMNFKPLKFSERMRNFARLSRDKEVYRIMAQEYAKLYNGRQEQILEQMWHYNQEFFGKRNKKRALKRKLKFFKK